MAERPLPEYRRTPSGPLLYLLWTDGDRYRGNAQLSDLCAVVRALDEESRTLVAQAISESFRVSVSVLANSFARADRLESELADERAKVERLEQELAAAHRAICAAQELLLVGLTQEAQHSLRSVILRGELLEPATPSEGAKCKECGGTGESLAMAPGGENCIFPPCDSCNGTGRALSEVAKCEGWCPDCEGTGLGDVLSVAYPLERSICDTCHGSRRAPGGKGAP